MSKSEREEDAVTRSASLMDRFQELTSTNPEAVAVFFTEDGTTISRKLTRQDLDAAARGFAAKLQRLGLAGERIVLMLPTCAEYLAAYLGCLYSGSVAVPCYPPRPNQSYARLRGVAVDSEPAAIVVSKEYEKGAREFVDSLDGMPRPIVLSPDESWTEDAERWKKPTLSHSTLAMLQYTSGSTGIPKGVMVSHGNILHNQWMIKLALRPDEHTSVMSWLPLHHDMGLIGGALTPICLGFPIYLMSPESFLMRPIRWLRGISEHRIRWAVGPNFAFQYCVQRIQDQDRDRLDLSSWIVALIGAEPVRSETLAAFAEKFGSCGFSPNTFYPCFGLAEATLFVTGGKPGVRPREYARSKLPGVERSGTRGPAETPAESPMVSCGRAWGDTTVVIAGDDGRQCAPGQPGEILISGPSVAQGYWKRPQETSEVFGARVSGHDASFLRTGDVGMIADGELYVTGRLKNMLIFAGRNIYLEDIEHAACRSHELVYGSVCAGLSLEIGQMERLVIVMEMDKRAFRDRIEKSGSGSADVVMNEVRDAIRSTIVQGFEVPVHDVFFAKTGSISRTSSGKTQHVECRDKYLSGTLNEFSP